MRALLILTYFIVTNSILIAQTSDRITREEYIEIYRDIAIREMNRCGVPASITLAQGALESGDGNSRLARIANNHFGIKCHNDWQGKRILEDDDKKNECFRKYQSVEDSYRDHSDYLRSTPRYASLFELDITDYKGWAKGLKKAGYATSPTYADKLIEIIEEFRLQNYDKSDAPAKYTNNKTYNSNSKFIARNLYEKNRVKYVEAEPGDTYESLTEEFGKLDWEILRYNDANTDDTLSPGQVVYLQPKRNKAAAGKETHTIKKGETMYSVSQEYAIKLSKLYSMNLMKPGTEPAPGTTLQLRKTLKGVYYKPSFNDDAPNGGEEEEEIKVSLNFD
jgi:LysM repeat protein